MGLFSKVAGIFAGQGSKKASRRAEQAQIDALNRAIEQQQQQFQQTEKRLDPFVQPGVLAAGDEADLLGLNGNDAAGSAIEALKASPLFASLVDTGEEAILANASATGGLRGGDVQSSLFDNRRDTLASVIENQLSRLGNVANRGVGAAGAVGQFGANAANNVSGFLQNQGQVRAGGLLTRAGISGQQLSNIGGLVDSAVNEFLPAGPIKKFLGKAF